MDEDFQGALRPTFMIDSDHPAVMAFARENVAAASSDKAKAIALYYAVRDGFRYDGYRIDWSPVGLRASTVLSNGYGWCVPKSNLLAAACRAVGVPARVGYADVRNHLSTARMREMMGTDIFYYHGYTSVRIDGCWVKATPAFNIELCAKMSLHPLEFDGETDSIYHPYDLTGQRHMEYLGFRGEHDDVPHADILRCMAEKYPYLSDLSAENWDADIAAEAVS
ncbi:MAG: transglutaminase family protein [Hyphomonadaceae bacterium]